MIQRPLVIITVSYIIGILWGIYLEINIYPFCIIILAFNFVIEKINKYNNNMKIDYFISFIQEIIYKIAKSNNKIIYICTITIMISNFYINYKENILIKTYSGIESINAYGIVVGENAESEYYKNYLVKIKNSNLTKQSKYKLKNTTILLKLKKDKINISYKYGDYIFFNASQEKVSGQRNYKGYDYAQYLRTKNIYAVYKTEYSKTKFVKENSLFVTNMWINNIKNAIKSNLNKIIPKENVGIAIALLIGDTSRHK